ncbi:ABC transporter permease subunit [Mollicutes bacterium LVI A0039]|nr:ABC transporter permease subunit [Mollicutes bacterium LVI A0039]
MNIVQFEVKRNLKTTIIWAVIVTLAGLLYTAMGPSFIDQSETLIAFMSGMGEDFLNGLGVNLDTFFSPIGFFAYVGGFIALALCVQAMIYGIKAFALEKNNKSLEFLYTKPNSRTNIFVQKYVSNIILLLLTQVLVIASLYIATDLVNTMSYDHSLMLIMLLTFVPLQGLFFTLGTIIGTSVSRLKSVVSVAMGVTLGMFFINMLAGVVGSDPLGYASFFNYYNLSDIAFNEAYDTTFVLISVGLMIGFTVISLIIFNKKDMKIT